MSFIDLRSFLLLIRRPKLDCPIAGTTNDLLVDRRPQHLFVS